MRRSSSSSSLLADGKLRLDHPAPHVARLTIENPAKRNALDHAILDAIASVLPTLEDDRCLLLTATGPVFSAGYDLGGFPTTSGFAGQAEALVAHPFTGAIKALVAFPYPTLAALNGHAIGGGLELAISCDLRLAAGGIRVRMPPAKLGLIYSHTGLRKFVDLIGVGRTRELFLLARDVPVERAEEWGLVNEVVPGEELEAHAVAYAAELAANAPLAQAGNKRVIAALLAAEGALAPEVERELIGIRESCFASEDFREGVRAFGEEREPRWRGR